jgi:hypothetical protein
MCVTNTLLLVVIALVVTDLALTGVLVSRNDSLSDYAPNLAILDTAIGFINSAHYPLPYEELERPDQGGCCHALCSGDTCFVGTEYTFDSRSCNLCCFHLVEPDSCDGAECACYANNQE